MMITTKTIVGFKVPDDYEQEQYFIKHNNMNEWIQSSTSGWISYIKEKTVEVKNEKERTYENYE